MDLSQADIEYYGLTRLREELTCEQCGKAIHRGDFAYRRYSNPVIHCVSCRKINKDHWIKIRDNIDEILKEVTTNLDENGNLDLNILRNDYKLSEIQINSIAKKIRERGYIIEPNKKSKHSRQFNSWRLRYTPIVQSFLDSVINLEDITEIAQRYHSNAHVISTIIHEITGNGKIIENDVDELTEYVFDLMATDIETIANTVYIERMSFDDSVYLEITKDNRNMVITYFVDSLFRLSNRISIKGYGELTEDGILKTYAVVTDNDDFENESGCDIEIIVTSEDVFVLRNDDSGDVCGLLEYLDLASDEESNNIIDMIKELLKRGF